jgi:hypothetical protein
MRILQYIVTLEILFPLFFGLLNFKRFGDRIAKPFLVYIYFLTILEIIALYLSVNNITNHIVYNILDICTVLLFLYLFWFERNKIFCLIFFFDIDFFDWEFFG